MNPLVKVAKELGLFTATSEGRDALEMIGFGPGSQFVCCERTDTVPSVSERSRSAEPPAIWAYLDEDEKLRLLVVDVITCAVSGPDGAPIEPQEYGSDTTVEMLAHVARTTGEKYFKPSSWDLPRRASVVDKELVSA